MFPAVMRGPDLIARTGLDPGAGVWTPTVPTGVAHVYLETAGSNAWWFGGIANTLRPGQLVTLHHAGAGAPYVLGTYTRSGRAVYLLAGDELTWVINAAGGLYQIGGNVGMGARFVPVNSDAIGDWPSPAASWQSVNLSDDGVRRGAVAALIHHQCYTASAVSITVQARTDVSGPTTLLGVITQNSYLGYGQYIVPLADGATFEVNLGAWTATTNAATVIGYWI